MVMTQLFKDRVIISCMNEFTAYVNDQLKQREWTISTFARRSGVSQSSASNVLNGKTPPSFEFVKAAAEALDENPIRLWRLAGLLESAPVGQEMIDELNHYFNLCTDHDKDALIRAARAFATGGDDRDDNTTSTTEEQDHGERENGPPLLGSALSDPDHPITRLADALVDAVTPEILRDIADMAEQFAEQARQKREQGSVPSQSGTNQDGGTQEIFKLPSASFVPASGDAGGGC